MAVERRAGQAGESGSGPQENQINHDTLLSSRVVSNKKQCRRTKRVGKELPSFVT